MTDDVEAATDDALEEDCDRALEDCDESICMHMQFAQKKPEAQGMPTSHCSTPCNMPLPQSDRTGYAELDDAAIGTLEKEEDDVRRLKTELPADDELCKPEDDTGDAEESEEEDSAEDTERTDECEEATDEEDAAMHWHSWQVLPVGHIRPGSPHCSPVSAEPLPHCGQLSENCAATTAVEPPVWEESG